MANECPAYVTRSIAHTAACDLINTLGWEALGVDTYEQAVEAINNHIGIDGKFAILIYTLPDSDEVKTLTYEWSQFYETL